MKNCNTLLLESSPKFDRRAVSKTARKFTPQIQSNDLPTSISVNLDWLSFMIETPLREPLEDEIIIWLSDDIAIENLQRGISNFKHSYKCYIGGEYIANMHTHPRNGKIGKPGTAKIEILNHVLYSSDWLNIVRELLECTNGIIKNITRLDIAYDGCNNIHKLLNMYAKQMPGQRIIWMKGRAKFDAKMLDGKTMMFNNFRVGSKKKEIVVYEKQQELRLSQKEYIRKVWAMNGMDTEAEQWRTELRMNSETIKEIKDFDLSRCLSSQYLLSIFRTQTKNFFEFVRKKSLADNISRCEIIDIFQFKKIKTALLEKIPRIRLDGLYKAKLSVHNAIKDVIQGVFKDADLITTLNHVRNTLDNYNLWKYYMKKKDEWIMLYQPVNPNKAAANLLYLQPSV